MDIEPGKYKAKVNGEIQYGRTSKDNDQLAIPLDLFGDDGAVFATVTSYLVFNDNTVHFQKDRLKSLGWDGKSLLHLEMCTQIVDVIVKYDEYEGRDVMKVDILTGAGGIPTDRQLDDKGKRAFAAKFGGGTAVSRTPPKRAPAPPKNGSRDKDLDAFPPNDILSDDDIGF